MGGICFGAMMDYYVDEDGEPDVSLYSGCTDVDGVEIYADDYLKHKNAEVLVTFENGAFMVNHPKWEEAGYLIDFINNFPAKRVGSVYERQEPYKRHEHDYETIQEHVHYEDDREDLPQIKKCKNCGNTSEDYFFDMYIGNHGYWQRES